MNLIKLFICSIAIIILLKMLIKRLNNIMHIIKKEKNKLDETIDNIKNKYGYTSIKRAGEMELDKFFK